MKTPIPQGIIDLIFEYFGYDVFLKNSFTNDLRDNIVSTFTYAYNHHISLEDLEKELEFSEIAYFRDRRRNIDKSYYKPFPMRLGFLKKELQEEASESNTSLHHYIIKILLDREKQLNLMFQHQCVKRMFRIYKKVPRDINNLKCTQLTLPLPVVKSMGKKNSNITPVLSIGRKSQFIKGELPKVYELAPKDNVSKQLVKQQASYSRFGM